MSPQNQAKTQRISQSDAQLYYHNGIRKIHVIPLLCERFEQNLT